MQLARISGLLLGLVLIGHVNLSAQADGANGPVAAVEGRSGPRMPSAVLDPRLTSPPVFRRRDLASYAEGGVELRWTESRVAYPLIGALIGGVAGAVYASMEHSGENALGFPIDPVLIFAPLGAMAGAVVGAIIAPSAER